MSEPRAAVHLKFPCYVVYDDGSVISHIKAPRLLSPIRMGNYVGLQLRSAKGETTKVYLHRLVAETFHGAPAPGQEVRHKDGIKAHNGADNLLWGTRIENMQDKNLHGTSPQGERHGGSKLTEREVRLIRRMKRAGIKQNLIATRFGVSQMTISRVANGVLWRHIDV